MAIEVISGDPSPSLQSLNKRAIAKLYELIDRLDAKSEPDMVRATVESLAKLNGSLRNSGIFPQEETEAERAERLSADAIREAMEM